MPGSPSPCAPWGTERSLCLGLCCARCTLYVRAPLGTGGRAPFFSGTSSAALVLGWSSCGPFRLKERFGGPLVVSWLGFSALHAAAWVPHLGRVHQSRVSDALPHPPVSCALT